MGKNTFELTESRKEHFKSSCKELGGEPEHREFEETDGEILVCKLEDIKLKIRNIGKVMGKIQIEKDGKTRSFIEK